MHPFFLSLCDLITRTTSTDCEVSHVRLVTERKPSVCFQSIHERCLNLQNAKQNNKLNIC